ncbi:MAG: cytochrome c family protein [Candidatus Marinimicrobia bacterium]|nr:cytochrome c family protein [Candidatus Neomarinimicrobiota bacterium]MCH7954531.1 cytochrome c family protein [Candidatus Neomarinimicrobiota bacterium]
MKIFHGVIIKFSLLITIIFCITSIETIAFIPPDGSKHKFVGVAKCKMCHKKEKKGLQYEIWKESGHSKAYDVLATPEAKELAEKNGIIDPQKDSKCLKCHTTGHDAPPELKGKKYKLSEGVGCESCHGAGGDYYKSKVMKGLRNGTVDPITVGLIIPNEETCTQCHNADDIMPIKEEFNFKKMWAKIAHPIPKG